MSPDVLPVLLTVGPVVIWELSALHTSGSADSNAFAAAAVAAFTMIAYRYTV